MQVEPIDIMDKTHRAAPERRPRLSQLIQGENGLEISLAGDALPAVLLEINGLLRSGRHQEARIRLDEHALHTIEDCVGNDPERTDVMYVAARLLWETGQCEPAERFLRLILEREQHPLVLADLATLIQQDSSRNSEARVFWQRAWELDPDNLEYLREYAFLMSITGYMEESVALFERAIRQAPWHSGLALQLVWNVNYLPGYDRAYLLEHATQWAARHAAGISGYTSYENEPSLTRKLKVGILSGDFMENSPMTFYEPALMSLNRDVLELYAYSSVEEPNIGTTRCEALFDVFRDIHAWPEPEVAAQVRQDGIDILIAFGGPCYRHRLGVIALRPAPVQVNLGAMCTLGMPQIDYSLTDDVLDPPDVQPYYTEELVYLSGGFVTFRPPLESPPVAPLPAQSNGYVTFGSFNSHLKMNDLVLDLWAQILRRVPNARLALKFLGACDPGVRERIIQRFEARGIDTDRIQVRSRTSQSDHLYLLSQTDLLLDCYPLNGSRTTLEGLWMGVPTITLTGTTWVSRWGFAIMKQLGLEAAFAAQTPQEYVDRACACAGQLDKLACIRSALRELLLSSSMCDPVRYARSLEEAFQYMWQQWCEKQNTEEKKAV